MDILNSTIKGWETFGKLSYLEIKAVMRIRGIE